MPCRFTFAGLTDKNTDLRKASAAAIGNIRDQAAVVLDQLAARHELPPEAVPELRSIYAGVDAGDFVACPRTVLVRSTAGLAVEKPVDLKATLEWLRGQKGALAGRERRSTPRARSIWVGFTQTTTIAQPTRQPCCRKPVRAKSPDGGRLGRHADGLAQRQAGLRFRGSAGDSSTSRTDSTSRLRKGRIAFWCDAAIAAAAGSLPSR